MRSILIRLSLLFCLVTILPGCFTHNHTVGSGAAGANATEKKQWYILFGLVPLNTVDSKGMAGGATNYTIKTQQSFVDVVIGLFTSFVTIYPQTVTVTK
jgi:hypothetical protein